MLSGLEDSIPPPSLQINYLFAQKTARKICFLQAQMWREGLLWPRNMHFKRLYYKNICMSEQLLHALLIILVNCCGKGRKLNSFITKFRLPPSETITRVAISS